MAGFSLTKGLRMLDKLLNIGPRRAIGLALLILFCGLILSGLLDDPYRPLSLFTLVLSASILICQIRFLWLVMIGWAGWAVWFLAWPLPRKSTLDFAFAAIVASCFLIASRLAYQKRLRE